MKKILLALIISLLLITACSKETEPVKMHCIKKVDDYSKIELLYYSDHVDTIYTYYERDKYSAQRQEDYCKEKKKDYPDFKIEVKRDGNTIICKESLTYFNLNDEINANRKKGFTCE